MPFEETQQFFFSREPSLTGQVTSLRDDVQRRIDENRISLFNMDSLEARLADYATTLAHLPDSDRSTALHAIVRVVLFLQDGSNSFFEATVFEMNQLADALSSETRDHVLDIYKEVLATAIAIGRDTNLDGGGELRTIHDAFAGIPEADQVFTNPFALQVGDRILSVDSEKEKLVSYTITSIEGGTVFFDSKQLPLIDLNKYLFKGRMVTSGGDSYYGGRQYCIRDRLLTEKGRVLEVTWMPPLGGEEQTAQVTVVGSNAEEMESVYGPGVWALLDVFPTDTSLITLDIERNDGTRAVVDIRPFRTARIIS